LLPQCLVAGFSPLRARPLGLLSDQAKFVAFGVGHHASAEPVLLEILQRESLTAQDFDLGGRPLNIVDPNIEVEASIDYMLLGNLIYACVMAAIFL
jgi:hypothetical protein